MSLLEKLKKNSTIKETEILEQSIFFEDKDFVKLPVPMLNVAFSGEIDGGLISGVTQFAGPSKHFKTAFCLLCASAYLKKYSDSVLLFYDSEFGSPKDYFKSFDIDLSRVIHTPITSVEQFKSDIVTQLDSIERGDHVIIVVDSIGNLASTKEIEDALASKNVADMTRAKAIKSLFRMITSTLKVKDIPLIAINHTYKTLEMYSKDVVGGGTGSVYAADNIFIIGRQQEKEKDELSGYNFIINVEKSRFVKEKSKIPVTVKFNGGVNKYSGLLELGLEFKLLEKLSKGSKGTVYKKVNIETGELQEREWKEKETNSDDFWNEFLNSDKFKTLVKNKYKLSTIDMLSKETEEGEMEE